MRRVGNVCLARIVRRFMFARRSNISLGGGVLVRTPVLIPSFSSKGFPELRKILRMMGEFITGGVLISAYDVHYRRIPSSKGIRFPNFIFLDSGGYEARVEHDLSESYGHPYRPKSWDMGRYHKVLTEWSSPVPTVVVTYDSPKQFLRLKSQFRRALELKKAHPKFPIEILVKPERKRGVVPIESLIADVNRLRDFALVGLTEKELGDSPFERLTNIARLRTALNVAGVDTPIHVFGSLDTLSTALYFVAGAEVFDGLTWLRFGYRDGLTVYSQNYALIRGPEGIRREPEAYYHEMWKDNWYYLKRFESQMINYVTSGGDAAAFGQPVSACIQEALRQLEAELAVVR
jgi:hypothetical protein